MLFLVAVSPCIISLTQFGRQPPVSQFFLDFASARDFPLSHFPSTLFWSLFPSNTLFFLSSFEMLFVLCAD
jgi:hypothetical protein